MREATESRIGDDFTLSDGSVAHVVRREKTGGVKFLIERTDGLRLDKHGQWRAANRNEWQAWDSDDEARRMAMLITIGRR